MSAETRFVAPALVRDYQRLTGLFPFTYRRVHQAEMLGHLLEAAAPGQSRPAPGETADLLRAAAREWLLAPLGSTAVQRREGTRALLVLLPCLLIVPAAVGLGPVTSVLATPGELRSLLMYAPMIAGWALWGAGMLLLLAGALRLSRAVLVTAATIAWATIVLLATGGAAQAAFVAVGWAVGQTACAVVVWERAGWGVPVRWAAWTRVLVLVVALVCAAPAALASGGSRAETYLVIGDAYISLDVIATNGFLYFMLVAGTAMLVSLRRTRQAVPVLAGIILAVIAGRTGLFGSQTAPLDVVDPGNVVGLIVAALVVTAAARWVVNRIDELEDDRASVRDGIRESSSSEVRGHGRPAAGA